MLVAFERSSQSTPVKGFLSEGWDLFASPFESTHQRIIIQPMVKFAPTRELSNVSELQYASGLDLAELTATVRRHIAEGWAPFGSLVIKPGVAQEAQFYQAMVRPRDDQER
jgi:hypothetical protein